MPDKTNWDILAGLRFVLASIVACSHLIYFERGYADAAIAQLGGKAAVIGFLLVSGYSIAASLDRSADGFYFRRFKRIYPLYLFAILAGVGLELWLGTAKLPFRSFEGTGPIVAIGNLFMLQTFLVKPIGLNPVVWSLAVEVSFYIISPFVRQAPRSILYGMIFVSMTFYLIPHYDHAGLIFTVIDKANAVKYFWPFGIGLLVYDNRSDAVFLLATLAGALSVWLSPINYEAFATVTFMISMAAIYVARAGLLPRSKVLNYLGDLSYPLYLFQLPTFIICWELFGVSDSFVLFGAVVFVSFVAYELIDVALKRMVFTPRNAPSTATT